MESVVTPSMGCCKYNSEYKEKWEFIIKGKDRSIQWLVELFPGVINSELDF